MESASELPIERSPLRPPHTAPESDPSVDGLAAEGRRDAGGEGMSLSDDDGVREAGVAHAPDGEDIVPVVDAASPVDNEEAETPPTVVKRKRGRPRKVPVVEKAMADGDDAVEDVDLPTPAVVADSSEKRRRGRPRKNMVASKAPVVKKGRGKEAVCFVCFDGGDLVICDKRGCTKVFHADCVQESYSSTRSRWNCGRHICSHCEKAAHYMCYTCTYSLCKACNKGSGFVCVRVDKGFCGTCYQKVMSIEENERTDGAKAEADLSGQTSLDELFKIYWSRLKGKLSLTFEKLSAANNRRRRPGRVIYNEDSSDGSYHVNDDQESGSDVSDDNEGKGSSRKKVRRRSRNTVGEEHAVKQVDLGTNAEDDTKWASSELLEFVSHMKDGDTSSLSHFEVHDLVLEYIYKNNLCDQHKNNQIICDSMLQKLFHKEMVAHSEMLKLLEYHFIMKEASQVIIDNNQGANLALDSVQMDDEGYHDATTKFTLNKTRKSGKRVEEKEPKTNIDDYAAIDVHNIKLIYLRRSLMEDLLDELDTFNEKVTGTFVRIRISGENKKQEIYRLVQVAGTHVAGEGYKLGKKATNIRLNIQNLDKTEVVPIDILSNQEFTEDECRHLRQSIKCRVIRPLTVGQVQDKATVLQTFRVDEWLESEKLQLCHLRDCASGKGRPKELRECVEKLQLLNKPEERLRMLNNIPEIHDDPKMDPDYESADEEPEDTQESSRKSSQPFYPRKGRNFASGKVDSTHFNGARRASNNIWEVKKSAPMEDARLEVDTFSNIIDKESMLSPAQGKSWSNNQHEGTPDQLNSISLETIYPTMSNAPSGPPITSETEVMWHYKDPALKVKGPFSLSQLREWNIGGYFPPDMTIWRMCDKRNDQYLLTDALNGKFQKSLLLVEPRPSGLPQPIVAVTSWLDNSQNHVNRNVAPSSTVFPAADNILLGSVPMVISAPQIVIPSTVHGRIRPSVWEPSSNVNILPGQVQSHMNYLPPVQPPINYRSTAPPVQANINFLPDVPPVQTNINFIPPKQPYFVSPVPFSGNNYRPTPFPGREGRGGNAGGWNQVQDVGIQWNPNMSGGQRTNALGYERRPTCNPSDQQSSGEARFPCSAIDSNNQYRNNMFNPPTRTPQPTGCCLTGGLGTPNMAHKTTMEITKSNEEVAGNSPWGSWSASAPDNTKKADGWNSWSAVTSALLEKTNTTKKADGPDSWPPVSSTLPYEKTTSGAFTAASTSNENQFFQGECPIPTLLCERQGLDDKDLRASFVENMRDKDKSIITGSESQKNLAPILVADDKTNEDEWSLPSPAPSTNPASSNQRWANGDTKDQSMVWDQAVQNLETTDGGKSSGWGEWEKSTAQDPSAQTNPNPNPNRNRGLGFSPGSTNISVGGAPSVSGGAAGFKGWGPPLLGGANQSFGSFGRAVGNTSNPGWGAPPQNPNWVAEAMRGGPRRPPLRGQRPMGVCKFHERGFCRKGLACQYRHV